MKGFMVLGSEAREGRCDNNDDDAGFEKLTLCFFVGRSPSFC